MITKRNTYYIAIGVVIHPVILSGYALVRTIRYCKSDGSTESLVTSIGAKILYNCKSPYDSLRKCKTVTAFRLPYRNKLGYNWKLKRCNRSYYKSNLDFRRCTHRRILDIATVADDLAQIRMPFAFELTAVRAFCNTAPTGANLQFDIEDSWFNNTQHKNRN